jgi:hypothetical protein
MSSRQTRPGSGSGRDEIQISEYAIGACTRLFGAVRDRIQTHASADGGLICEARTGRSRPTFWRVSPDGGVLPDSPYNFALRAFITAELPGGVSGRGDSVRAG